MTHYTFNSNPRRVGKVDKHYTGSDIVDETMLRAVDWDFAHTHGGPVLKEILTQVPTDWQGVSSINVKVHRLIKGYYPSPIGWHSDTYLHNLARHENHTDIQYLNIWVGDAISPTEYFTGKLQVPADHFNHRELDFWYKMNSTVEEHLSAGHGSTLCSRHGEMIQMDGMTMHRSSPSRFFGARMLIALIRDKHHTVEGREGFLNRIEKTSTVYVKVP